MTWETGQPPPDMSQLMQSGFLAGGNQPLFDDATLTRLQELAAKFGAATKEDERYARGIGLLTAAAGTLAARTGNPLEALGRGGLLGIGAQQNVLQDAAQRRGAGLQNIGAVMNLSQQMQAMKDDAQYRQAVAARAGGAPMPSSAPSGMPQQRAPGPTPTSFGSAPAQAAPRLSTSKMTDYQRAIEEARYLEKMGVAPKYVEQAWAKAEKLRPELNSQKTLVDQASGQRVTVNVYKDGTTEVVPFAPDREKAVTTDEGGQITPRDPFTYQPIAAPIPKTVTPGESANISLARQRLAMEQGNQGLGRANDLRKEFGALPQVKSYQEILPVLQSAREAVKDDTGASDLNLIYAAAKVFDPGSVVRESETTMVMGAGSPAQQFMGKWNHVLGGGSLTPQVRKELMAQIESRARGWESSYKAARTQFETVAKRQAVDPSQVFIEPQTQPMPRQEQPSFDYGTIKPGTVYTAPDGTRRVKK